MIREYAEVKYRQRIDPQQPKPRVKTKIKPLPARGIRQLLREIERHGHDLVSISRMTKDEYLARKDELAKKRELKAHDKG
ncbi:hypothetical protein [Brevibacillus fulvus]|uniref:Uncharacterized protein n=1 Tax=Brevibacillus fulvus TaxID=1125967 RepID=A0A939BSY4_9BACL|nr:hypothetical protein [Brevibacillus fulvus]MBM7591227.1 hypothetical protein [Brevibacillus fulvus]